MHIIAGLLNLQRFLTERKVASASQDSSFEPASGDPHAPEELLDRIESLLQLSEADGSETAREGNALASAVEELRALLGEQRQQLEDVRKRSELLTEAQAEALDRSAETIDELERTKRHLSEARQAAESAALDTRRLADTIFERTSDGVFVFRGEKCVACNDNALKLLRSERAQILAVESGNSSFDVDTSGTDRSILCVLQDLLKSTNDQPSTLEARLELQDEASFWAEITTSFFPMQGVDHVLMVVRDISSRKEFECELKRQRDFLNNIINAVPDQLAVRSPSGRLVVVNNAFCEAMQVDPDEVIGQKCDSLPLPSGCFEDHAVESGDCWGIDQQQQKSYSVKRSLFRNDQGDEYLISTSRDVTEERIRENRLRLLASVFDGASEGVAILSPSGEIVEANPAFADMSSCSQQQLVGRQFTDSLHFDTPHFDCVLSGVSQGSSWSGKAKDCQTHDNCHSYWVSLSPSRAVGDQASPIIALVSDISELENTQAKLRRQAYFDNLTGLPNRRYFREHLTRLLVKSESALSVCFLDLDDFKNVNDSAGHSVGDRLLQAVAKRITQCAGEDGFVARFGGDEFAIISPHEPNVVDQILESLHASFREPFDLRGTEAHVGLSIGVTRYPEHGDDVDTLMSNADIAMYAAKTAGKNLIRQFASEMQQEVNLRTEVQTRLRHALEVGELSLWFQPKVCAITRRPKGCEALVRWKTADGEYISPGDFIPIAEQTGLILPLGEVVFDLAAEHASRWARQGMAPDVAVNVSPQQLRHPRFLSRLMKTLVRHQAEPEWFEIEITEYAVMDDVEHATEVIQALKDVGFRVGIDDFGTGYSSLGYIKSFALNTLKIDMCFVHDIAMDAPSQAVVRSIVSLGLGLNMSVVAEGVETESQAAILAEIGCTTLQGYYLGKPMPEPRYLAWYAEHTDTGNDG